MGPGLYEDMPSFGVFCFEIGDDGRCWFEGPETFFQIENGQIPVGLKIAIQFFKDGDHDCYFFTICSWVPNRRKIGSSGWYGKAISMR